jgi:hypothetical protein
LARIFLFSLSSIWIFFAFGHLNRSIQQDWAQISTVITALTFGNASAYLFAAVTINNQKKFIYLLILLLIAANILLTFTDQVGTFDIATFALNAALAVLLVVKRKEFIQG